MPIYNRESLIAETLASIAHQSYKNWECLIVDDGSTDNTITAIRNSIGADTRFKLFERPRHIAKGPSACRNYAIAQSKGAYIQFFDSDDIMHPQHLERKEKAIRDNDLVVCKLQEFTGDFNTDLFLEDRKPQLTVPKHPFLDFVSGRFPMMMVAPMWKVASLKPYLPIREDLHLLEDHELYARALVKTKNIAVVDKSLIYYREGMTSSTQNFYTNIDSGLDSYLQAKATVLQLTQDETVKESILRMTLGFFRQAVAERNFKAAKKCLQFIEAQALCYNLELKRKYRRIKVFYGLFKIIKRGDTRFKPMFKL
jgi:glycosyltransferase involved in cell wall biosynthesis